MHREFRWKAPLWLMLLAASFLASGLAADLKITGFNSPKVTWSNAFPAGVMTLETASSVIGPWTPRTNYFTGTSVATGEIPPTGSNTFVRLLGADISTNNPAHFTNM